MENHSVGNSRQLLYLIAEFLVFGSLVLAYMMGYIPFTATPFLLILAWISLWRRKLGWKGVGLKKPPSWIRTILLGILIGLGYQTLSLYLIEPAIARWIGHLPDVSQFQSLVGNLQLLLIWLVIAWTLAAFLEEMIFRGYLINRLNDVFGRKSWPSFFALLISSMVFGIVHMYQDWSGVLVTGLFGFVFGAAYLIAGRNLWIPIIAHGVADTMGFILIYFGKYPGI
jgi:membrane protease YdiL (CAAX protease family)